MFSQVYIRILCLAHIFIVMSFGTAVLAQETVENSVDYDAILPVIHDIIEQTPITGRPKLYDLAKKKWVPISKDLFTKDVLADYGTVIRYISSRTRLQLNVTSPRKPHAAAYFNPTIQHTDRIIYHMKAGVYFVDKNGHSTFPSYDHKEIRPLDQCVGECAKLLLEDYVDSVVYISVHPDTREIMPHGVFEFTRPKNCNIGKDSKPYYIASSHALPALGLCIERKEIKPPTKGLHVYTNTASPRWPDVYETDAIRVGPERSQSPKAFESLKHVSVYLGQNPVHRALEINNGFGAPDIFIEREYACISITPSLPKAAIELIYRAEIPQMTRHNSDIKFSDGGLCYGDEKEKHTGFFDLWATINGKLDFAKILSPQEIEDNLTQIMKKAQSLGPDGESHWAALAEAIDYLQQYHTGFDNDIASRIAPILIELAKYDLKIAYNAPLKVLKKMPHKSMAPYIDDLKKIVEVTARRAGCDGLKCSKEIKDQHPELWGLAEIFNGAGPDAAEYLDTIHKNNLNIGGSMGGSWYNIGGVFTAAGCIGEMGPLVLSDIKKRAFKPPSRRAMDRPHGAGGQEYLQMLRTTPLAPKAKQNLIDQLAFYNIEMDDPYWQPSWARTHNLYGAVKTLNRALLAWDTQTPFCKSRGT